MNTDSNSEIGQPAGLEEISDRFGFCLLVAASLHVAVVLGIGFSKSEPDLRARSLDITLAHHRSDAEVDEAEFLAQFDQLGAGDQAVPQEFSSPVESVQNSKLIMPTQNQESADAKPTPLNSDKVLAARSDYEDIPEAIRNRVSADPGNSENGAENADSELASLVTKLGVQQQAYARRPKIMRLTAVAARKSDQALYLHNWESRIESIGNANYPQEARRQRLYGDLRLLVAIRSDGSVASIEILQSSGAPVLDRAARRIVRLAEPFERFPPELKEKADIIEIIRTWRFSRNRLSADQ